MLKTLLVIFIFIAFQSCRVGIRSTLKNDEINKNEREKIKTINDKFFKAIISNDVTTANQLMTGDALKNGNLGNFFDQASVSLNSFKTNRYTILDEYRIHNTTTGIVYTYSSDNSGNNDYRVSYNALTQDMYISLLLYPEFDSDLLATIIFGKYGDEWKIVHVELGQYSLFKKTVSDYYKLAKDSYDKSYFIDAVNNISISKKLLRPAAAFFQYQKETEINKFFDKVISEAKTKYPFPFTLENIDTKPKVFKIFPDIITNGTYKGADPTVCYLSNIDLKDTVALKTENEKVKKEVGRIFFGINHDKKFVFYRAFNELPDSNGNGKNYYFIDVQTE
jgi:hypothetical protein